MTSIKIPGKKKQAKMALATLAAACTNAMSRSIVTAPVRRFNLDPGISTQVTGTSATPFPKMLPRIRT
jgi:hypothetical protein